MASITNILVGSLVGAAAGMLLAPRSGEDTRAAILDMASDLMDQAGDTTSSARSMADELTKENTKMANRLKKQAMERASDMQRRGQAIKAILQGKDVPDQKSMLGTFASGMLLGTIVGAAVGMITAPRSGAEMRAALRDKGNQLKDQVGQTANTARDKAQQLADTTRGKADQVSHEARARAENLQQRGQQMVQEKQEQTRRASSM